MAPRIFFRASVTCPRCGVLNDAEDISLSSSIGSDAGWTFVNTGGAFELTVADLEDGFLLLRPPEGDVIRAIEFFVCKTCKLFAPVELELRVRTPHIMQFVGATPVRALTAEVLDRAHFLTHKIEEWTSKPGEDVQRIEDLKKCV